MGGRKSYSISYIIGETPEVKRYKKKLIDSVKSRSPKDIVQTTVNLFAKSDKVMDNFVKIVDTFDFVEKNATRPYRDYDTRKKIASDYWIKRKKEKKISVTSEFDRIVVDSLAKVIRRGEKK